MLSWLMSWPVVRKWRPYAGVRLPQVARLFGRRRELEQQLQALTSQVGQREAEAVLLFDLLPEGVLLADDHGRILRVNRHLATMFGYPEQELLGLPVEMLLPAALRSGHVAQRESYHRVPAV